MFTYFTLLGGAQERLERKEMELGPHNKMDGLAAKVFLNSRFRGTVFVTVFRTAVETAVSEVHCP